MKRYISLLLALVMVVGLIPTTGVLATEENTAPAVVEENFDDIALEFPSVDTIPGVGEYTAAQVKPAPDREGYALWVGDEAQSVVPELHYSFEDTSNVTVEFDVNVSDKNALNVLRLYNDEYNNFTKVAMTLNFSNQGLRYYNGKDWSAYNADVTLPVNQWVTIRVEIIPGKDGEAKIYVGDTNVLTIPGSELQGTMASNANSINGIYFASNKADRTFYLDNLKIDAAPYQATYTPNVSTSFEAMEAGSAPGDPIINAGLATVVALTNDESTNNVLHLNDNSTSASAAAGLNVEDSEVLTTAFKYKGVKGALQMYITDGGRSTANTAYFLQFSGSKVEYYDGSAWQTLTDLGYNLTNWTNISIEAGQETAKIYVKGELVAEAPRTGGSYGTNVTDVLDSVYFAIGGAAAVDSNCYLDDMSLSGNTRDLVATPNVSCDFESMTVDAAPTAPALDVLQTTVISRVNGSGKLAAQVSDLESTGAGNMRFALSEKTGKMVAEFDLVTWVGPIQFAISNGSKANNNMAYWLQIHAQNIKYHNGTSWAELKVMDAALGGGWHKIRIEADLKGADLYIDGNLMGTATRCSSASYGKNVTDGFDSLVFICGGNDINTYKYIVDNVNVTGYNNVIVTPDLIDETFDSYAPTASVESVEQIVASKAATIVADPVGEGNAILLHDETGATFGSIDYAFDPVDSYILEYDALIPTSANDVCMQIHAGQEGNRMAYILAFNRAYGLRVLTGRSDTSHAWVNLEETATKLTPNTWNKIRVEVNTGEEQSASIYLNGDLIAVTSEAYYRANDIVGANIYSGAAAQNVYIDNLKVTVVEPEDDSIDGIVDTEVGLMLEQNVTIDALTVEAGTVLDLNGCALTVTDLAVFGSIIDTSEGSTGKVISENALFSGDMEYMPIYDSENGCYKFYAYELKNLGVREAADGVKYGFAIDFANADAYALLASADCGVDVTMTLAWGENALPFAFNAELVQQYAGLQAKYPALRAAMMLTVSGVGTLEAGQTVTVTPAIQAAGMVANGEAMVYTVP